jgi:hypothetical protein
MPARDQVDELPDRDRRRPVEPPPYNPLRNEEVVAWVRERALRELTQEHG